MSLSEGEIDSYIKKIACTGDSLGMDDYYPCQSEFDLLKLEASSVVPRIRYFLEAFARGEGGLVGCPDWHYGGRHLIRLLGEINSVESMDLIADTLRIRSNIAEWYWNIQRQSAIELGNSEDEKWLSVLNDSLSNSMAPVSEISAAIEKISGKKSENPMAILNNADRTKSGLELIEHLYQYKDKMAGWSADERGYYYYLMAVNSEKVDTLKDTDVPKSYYAAQLFENPVNTSLGWMKFDKTPSSDNAKLLHEKYPVPDSFDDLKNLINENLSKKDKTSDSDMQLMGRVNPINNTITDAPGNTDDSSKKVEDVSDKNSKDNVKSDASTKDVFLNNYLKSINESVDSHREDFDSKLIKISDEGEVTDLNDFMEVLKDAGKNYGIMLVLLMILVVLGTFFSGPFTAAIMAILVMIILVFAIILILSFVDCLRSSRDKEYKLKSSVYILPLVLLFAYSSFTFGIMETLMFIGVLIVIGIIGLIFAFICGIFN